STAFSVRTSASPTSLHDALPISAGWCEIHHVIPWAENQVTDVSNGVALCGWHHRTIETSGWDIRMRDGVPEIKAPPGIDPEQKRSEEHTSELQSRENLVCRLLLE